MTARIKRWIVTMGVISLAGPVLAACGKKQEAEPEAEAAAVEAAETAAPTPEEKIGKLIANANDSAALIEKYGSVAWRIKTYQADGTVQSGYIYQTGDYYYSEGEGSFFVDDDGDVYGYAAGAEHPEYRCLFVDDGYKEYQDYYEDTGWSPDDVEDSVLAGEADEDGMVTVEASRNLLKDEKTSIRESGYTGLKSAKLRSVYTVDEFSYEIAEEKIYLVKKNDEETLIQEKIWLFDEEKPKMEQAYMDRVFSDDFRKVKVIVDPGSPKEQTYTQSVGKGCSVLTIVPMSFDPKMYADAACTKEWTDAEADVEADCTLYVLSTEGGHGAVVTQGADDGDDTAETPDDESFGEENQEAGEETAQCPTCGKSFSVDDSDGQSEYEEHVELEQRLESARIHLDDQIPLAVVNDPDTAKECAWCGNWYSTTSTDGATSDYSVHVEWEKEYENVYNSLHK